MHALDTNLLVYAHNTASPFHFKAKTFIEDVMNKRELSYEEEQAQHESQ